IATQAVEDAMRPPEAVLLRGDESVERSMARAEQVSSDYFLVPLEGGSWGGVSRSDLMRMGQSDLAERPLGSVVRDISRPYLYPDQSMESALRVLHERPFVPVVHRADPARLVGMIALEDVLELYRVPTTPQSAFD